MNKKIELLVPVGSLANLKAAVSRKADAVYLGMNRFSARQYATNFNESYLKEAVKICKSNHTKLYLTMNTLVKNHELKDFFKQLSYAYSQGIDAVIIQEISLLNIIKKFFPDLRVHISTQAGVMNSQHANLLSAADRINLSRELTQKEISLIRKNFKKELEIFCHGALCVSISGSCLFSSLLGGRSGNRGQCAQPCRQCYNNSYLLSTKDLCLIHELPEIIKLGINSIKIEGRMRTPYYVATVTEIYKQAINSYYQGCFQVTSEMKKKLATSFNREFTAGWYKSSQDIFNLKNPSGQAQPKKEFYQVQTRPVKINRPKISFQLPNIKSSAPTKPRLLVRVYNQADALKAAQAGADLVYLDIFHPDFNQIKKQLTCPLFAVTPRIMLDQDILQIKDLIKKYQPAGLLAGNLGLLRLNLNLPIHLDYNCNAFNDLDLNFFQQKNCLPIISPELSFKELKDFQNKNFAVLVHGKIRLMTLRHQFKTNQLTDQTGARFQVNQIKNGSEIINAKELGLLSKAQSLVKAGLNQFYIDTDQNVETIVPLYKKILNHQKVNDQKLKKNYVLAWFYREVN